MSASQQPAELSRYPHRSGYRRRLHLLYMLLAGFQLLTIAASLFVSYRLEKYYSRALASDAEWNTRRHQLAELEQLAVSANTPDKEALESGEWEGEQSRIRYAGSIFLQRSDQLIHDLKQSPDPESQTVLPDAMSLPQTMGAALHEADQVFEVYQSGDVKQVEAHLIYTDRAFARVKLALGNLREDTFRFEEDNVRKQAEVARGLRKGNVLVGSLALLLVVGVVLYSRRLYHQIQANEAELLAERAALERRVQERTTELRTEIEERKRIESFDRSRNQLLEMVAQNEPVAEILKRLADALEEHRPQCTAVIWLVGDSAASSICRGSLESKVRQLSPAALQESPMAIAERDKKVVIMADLRGEEGSAAGELAGRRGLGAWWAAPVIRSGDAVWGTVSMVFSQPCEPGERDGDMLQAAARIAGLAAEHRHMHGELLRQAQYDQLTGLPNRVLCEDRLQQAIARSRRHGRTIALLCIDLDDFKLVNDTYGHVFGDALLKQVSTRLSSHLRSSDTLGRMGGDEFLMIAEEVASGRAVEVIAANLLATMAEPFLIDECELRVSASIGAALYPADGLTADQLQRHADHAMYRAKEQGRNQYQMFSLAMSWELQQRRNIEIELQKALEGNRLEVWYQPQFDREGSLSGLEALLRFHHPSLGMISPDRFIPIAEESGLIVNIGDWVLQEVCRQSLSWQAEGLAPVRIAVNVSASQFSRDDFAQNVAHIVRARGLAPGLLEIELTESLVMSNIKDSARQMRALKDLGVHLSIDDFGTGYSSLSYLHQLPIDALKIDRSFVEHITEPAGTLAIVQAIVALARKLGLHVIGEGVETKEQLSVLHETGCDFVQGYLFSKPVPAAATGRLLAEKRSVRDLMLQARAAEVGGPGLS
jgi:diguanylate cyclase (GGDEF)-like protein